MAPKILTVQISERKNVRFQVVFEIQAQMLDIGWLAHSKTERVRFSVVFSFWVFSFQIPTVIMSGMGGLYVVVELKSFRFRS